MSKLRVWAVAHFNFEETLPDEVGFKDFELIMIGRAEFILKGQPVR